MKLSKYAKDLGIHYQTAWLHYKAGEIEGAYTLPSGTIIVPDGKPCSKEEHTAIYGRVSSHKQKDDLVRQVDRISSFCNANGWSVKSIYKEIASGLNDNRKQLNKLLNNPSVTRIVVEHKDRLTRFGFNYIKKICDISDIELIVINEVEDDKCDLIQDFVSIITSMVVRLYGIRRSKRKTEKLIMDLKTDGTSS